MKKREEREEKSPVQSPKAVVAHGTGKRREYRMVPGVERSSNVMVGR